MRILISKFGIYTSQGKRVLLATRAVVSTAEKQRTARDIVCFIYLLNPEHVRAHLSGVGVQNFEAEIEKWCNDIKSFSNGM